MPTMTQVISQCWRAALLGAAAGLAVAVVAQVVAARLDACSPRTQAIAAGAVTKW
jgi:hypothetical protein